MAIGVTGAAGRMGRSVIQAVLADPRARLAGGCEAPGHPAVGTPIRDPGSGQTTGLDINATPESLFAASDVVIDFTAPAASTRHAALAAETGTALVIGTTGLGPAEQAAIAAAAARAPILVAANFSLGINLLLALTRLAAARLGPDYDLEVLDFHHRHKKDAPSGTALALLRAAAEGRGLAPEAALAALAADRDGVRKPGALGFAVLRGGDVVGEHSVILAGEGERLELTHRASDRTVFARGALAAARWLAGRPPGLYSMADVLGLETLGG
ncbi:MAG: 4-hydroxy-tetrahydrodipicolinate reductase [Alphaproteobacteria bacterium]|nr:MAG: 4-hydroxy-tetrahydrodipicolinate reductase [Alphaproteobacteria bacterium]